MFMCVNISVIFYFMKENVNKWIDFYRVLLKKIMWVELEDDGKEILNLWLFLLKISI